MRGRSYWGTGSSLSRAGSSSGSRDWDDDGDFGSGPSRYAGPSSEPSTRRSSAQTPSREVFSRPLDKERLKQVQVGLSKGKVVQLLGHPRWSAQIGKTETLGYIFSVPHKSVKIELQNGLVSSVTSRGY